MSTSIDVFRGSDRTLYLSVPLISLLKISLHNLLGQWTDSARVTLSLHPVPDDDVPPAGPPTVRNLLPQCGYATVEITIDGRVVYRHPHTTVELIGHPLQLLLAQIEPGEAEWGYTFSGLSLPRSDVNIPVPDVQGSVQITPFAAGEQPRFQIKRLPDPAPQSGRLADYGVTVGEHAAAPVKVILDRQLFQNLVFRQFSADVEEGGFLLGRVFEDADAPGTFLVKLTAAPAAQHTGASLLHLTFTGDSFEAVKRELRTGSPDDRLVGWYHTHLFAAAEEMGLSSVDIQLHSTTFLMPWQLAGLVNITKDERTLRFYTRRQDAMVLCPQWVTDASS